MFIVLLFIVAFNAELSQQTDRKLPQLSERYRIDFTQRQPLDGQKCMNDQVGTIFQDKRRWARYYLLGCWRDWHLIKEVRTDNESVSMDLTVGSCQQIPSLERSQKSHDDWQYRGDEMLKRHGDYVVAQRYERTQADKVSPLSYLVMYETYWHQQGPYTPEKSLCQADKTVKLGAPLSFQLQLDVMGTQFLQITDYQCYSVDDPSLDDDETFRIHRDICPHL